MPQLTSVHDAADLVSSSPSRSNHNSYRAAKQSSPCPPYRPAAPSANDCGSYDTPAETRRAVEKPRLAQARTSRSRHQRTPARTIPASPAAHPSQRHTTSHSDDAAPHSQDRTPIKTPAPCRIVLKRRLIRLVDRIHIYCSL